MSAPEDLKFSKKKQLKKTITKDEFKAIYHDEASLQRQAESYLDHLYLEYYRVPDGVYKLLFGGKDGKYFIEIPEHIRSLFSSFFKGVPDLTIFKNSDFPECRALRIEFKTKTGKQTQSQKKRAAKAHVVVVRSFDHFKQLVDDFIKEQQP